LTSSHECPKHHATTQPQIHASTHPRHPRPTTSHGTSRNRTHGNRTYAKRSAPTHTHTHTHAFRPLLLFNTSTSHTTFSSRRKSNPPHTLSLSLKLRACSPSPRARPKPVSILHARGDQQRPTDLRLTLIYIGAPAPCFCCYRSHPAGLNPETRRKKKPSTFAVHIRFVHLRYIRTFTQKTTHHDLVASSTTHNDISTKSLARRRE
ncbi:hypothetical protein CI238_09764, partial [Colletotrichum incanum]